MMNLPEFHLCLPDWVAPMVGDPQRRFVTLEERMQLVLDLAQRNVMEGEGGPFGAAVFEWSTGELIAPGVNRVIPAVCSAAHAEMVAITLAQQRLGQYVLGLDTALRYELVTSTEPCAMCLGAIPWSGVVRVVCGARDEDARRIGFDEGDKPQNWQQCLQRRGIEVVCDLYRSQAVAILQEYMHRQGTIYNGRK